MPEVALAAERFPFMSRKPVHIRSWHLEKTPKQLSVLQQTFHYPPDCVCKILRPIEVEAMATWDDHNLCFELPGQQVRDLLVDGQLPAQTASSPVKWASAPAANAAASSCRICIHSIAFWRRNELVNPFKESPTTP